MSRLGSILQPRALPPSARNILFSDCSPEVPAMLNVLLKSWQNTGTHSIVNVSDFISEGILEHQDPQESPESATHLAHDGLDCAWMSRLAAEWQVGIETLVSNSAAIATKRLDTVSDTTNMPQVWQDAALETCSNATSTPEENSSAPAMYLANKLIEAVQNGSTSTVEQVLQLISRQSQSTVAVLLELKENFGKNSNSPLSVDWETGWDANARPFTRVSFTLLNDWSKGSGATKLIIGSDGTTYATFTERWNATPIYLSPNDALAKVKGSNLKRLRDFNKLPQKTQISMTELRSLKAPRHFKAS